MTFDDQKMNGLLSIDGIVIQLYLSCSTKIVVIFKGATEVPEKQTNKQYIDLW